MVLNLIMGLHSNPPLDFILHPHSLLLIVFFKIDGQLFFIYTPILQCAISLLQALHLLPLYITIPAYLL